MGSFLINLYDTARVSQSRITDTTSQEAIARIVRRSDKPFGGIQVQAQLFLSLLTSDVFMANSWYFLGTFVSFLQYPIVVRMGFKYRQLSRLKQKAGTVASNGL